MKRIMILAATVVLLASAIADAETIKPGETREVSGVLKAVELQSRTVVLDSPTPKGLLTVGCVVKTDATVRVKGKAAKLESLAVGKKARIRYTRVGDQLMLLSISSE
jgi:hypothetical protein